MSQTSDESERGNDETRRAYGGHGPTEEVEEVNLGKQRIQLEHEA